jgi:hypothetical protein
VNGNDSATVLMYRGVLGILLPTVACTNNLRYVTYRMTVVLFINAIWLLIVAQVSKSIESLETRLEMQFIER